ncbi:MAG: hypothetical protein R2864_02525 [Syntrophotaleaceae bacterium]
MMESTPVSGVETGSAAEAPLLAPCLRRPMAAGITPQEHRGKGRRTGRPDYRAETAAPQVLGDKIFGDEGFKHPGGEKAELVMKGAASTNSSQRPG